jgi:hypothetical protein
VIYSNIWEARNKWFNIGLSLNLEVSDLEEIRHIYRDKMDDCFLGMLKNWLRTSPRPTQSNLITALRERTVGFSQLAEELESKSLKRDRIINQLGMASTKLTTKISPAHSQVKFYSVIKIGAVILILLFIAFIIWKATTKEAKIGALILILLFIAFIIWKAEVTRKEANVGQYSGAGEPHPATIEDGRSIRTADESTGEEFSPNMLINSTTAIDSQAGTCKYH